MFKKSLLTVGKRHFFVTPRPVSGNVPIGTIFNEKSAQSIHVFLYMAPFLTFFIQPCLKSIRFSPVKPRSESIHFFNRTQIAYPLPFYAQ